MQSKTIYLTPKPIYLISQNQELRLARRNPPSLYNLNLIFSYPSINLAITFFDQNENELNTIGVYQSIVLKLKNSNYGLIKWNDSNNYTVYGFIQEILPQTYEQYEQLLSNFDLEIQPISNIYKQVITSLPFVAPYTGTFQFLVQGSGVVAQAVINNNSYNINEGSALDSGAIYQFSLKLTAGTSVNLQNCTFLYGVLEGEI